MGAPKANLQNSGGGAWRTSGNWKGWCRSNPLRCSISQLLFILHIPAYYYRNWIKSISCGLNKSIFCTCPPVPGGCKFELLFTRKLSDFPAFQCRFLQTSFQPLEQFLLQHSLVFYLTPSSSGTNNIIWNNIPSTLSIHPDFAYTNCLDLAGSNKSFLFWVAFLRRQEVKICSRLTQLTACSSFVINLGRMFWDSVVLPKHSVR